MKEVIKYTFQYDINGKLIEEEGSGTNQFNAESNAMIKIMRDLKIPYKDIKFVKVLKEENTDEWI